MKPLRVALVVKNTDSTRWRETRNMGWWSYEVPEFTWDHFCPANGALNLGALKRAGFDLAFHEDGGNWCDYANRRIPVAYLSIDSTLSDDHLRVRREQARKADLVLVDHDDLGRFADCGPPARRLNYCVNDRLFRPQERKGEVDVSFHCSTGEPGGGQRKAIRQFLHEWAKEWDRAYRSGVLPIDEYATAMARSKIVVNWPRTPANRPHRIFDAMACGACMLTGPVPAVDGDGIVDGKHMRFFDTLEELDERLVALFETGQWEALAVAGYALVMERHTWAVRARQLREMLSEVLGL